MSHTRETDNEEALFQFDSYEGPVDRAAIQDLSLETFTYSDPNNTGNLSHNILPFALSSPDLLGHILDQPLSRVMDERDPFIESSGGKGKSVSRPMDIRPSVAIHTLQDNFDIGGSSSGHLANDMMQPRTSFTHSSPLSSTTFDLQSIQTPLDDIFYHNIMGAGREMPGSFDSESQIPSGSLPDKGKGKELAPVLPPLQFSPTEFGYSKTDWPSPGLITSTPGPSSYGSGYGLVINSNLNSTMGAENHMLPPTPPILRRMPSRRRSLSNLSMHSTRSMTALSMSRIRVKFGASKGPGNLARKLLTRSKTGSPASSPSHTPGTTTPGGHIIDGGAMVGQGSCLMPWRNDSKSQIRDIPPPMPYMDLDARFDHELPVYGRSQTVGVDLKGKGRSYSSPLPLSALDIIPTVPTDIFTPIPIVPQNFFDEVLPRELRLRVLFCLLELHEAEHERAVKYGRWSVSLASASKSKWVGKDRGVRELIKFSRISKAWQALVFDGQMWSNLDLRAFPRIPPSLLTRLSETAGTFVKAIDLAGHASLLPSTLLDVTNELCLAYPHNILLSNTQLTTVNFQGCAALTTRSLHHLLIRSPSLRDIHLKGLTAVTNTTCDVIGTHCPQLTSLDIGRCINVDGEGLRLLVSAGIVRGDSLPLKELRVSGLKRVNDGVLMALGRGAPLLEVLDLSQARRLHNSALEAFVSCSEDDTHLKTVALTAREAGREPGEAARYYRRITHLRHLSLSSCTLLTDIACSNLAHTMPQLELLELAGIGAELKDEGLVRLLNTTPLLKRLDLEDASDITDTVLAAITPSMAPAIQLNQPPEPGYALEHLVVSYAINITDGALMSLIQNCTRLTTLEADNTRMSGTVLKEFVRLSRERKTVNPTIVAIDCRGIGESLVKGLTSSTRPRKGWIAYEARKLGYVDGNDKEDLKVGRDECDEMRVVLKSFYSWQTVDAVRAARDKRRKARRAANASNGSTSDSDDMSSGRSRWWAPSGRRSSGTTSPATLDTNSDRDQCRIM